MTPLTPITKVGSLEEVIKGEIPEWSSTHVWLKGRVVSTSNVGFTIDDGTGTIFVRGKQQAIGVYLLCYGTLYEGYYPEPTLMASDVHLVIFFQDVTHVVFVAVLGCVGFLINWYRQRKNFTQQQFSDS